jgi:hypothetical protein
MSYTVAHARVGRFREALLDHGVKAVSIELVEGRGGQGWDAPTHLGTMGHHIASRRSQGNTPFLNLVKVGRADLPGPLCNGYGGFDEVARIICMGWANHSGAGGPYTIPAGTVPVNNGRPYFFGWEFEGGIVEADFTDPYRLFMARCLAGTLDWLGQPVAAHIEHKTWAPTRKSDRLGYTLQRARQEIEDTMADHKHVVDPSALPRSWADTPWAQYLAAGGSTVPASRTYEAYREDIAWFYAKFVAPLEKRVAALEATDNDTSSGIPYGATVRLERT